MMISRRNQRSHDYVEVGVFQRKCMVVFHILWFLAMLVEKSFIGRSSEVFSTSNIILCVLLVFAMILRYLSMRELGSLWSTKVFKIPRDKVVKSGIYAITNNGNYLGVVFELFIVPFLFKLYLTAIVFSIINCVFLYFRIALEREILVEGTYYE